MSKQPVPASSLLPLNRKERDPEHRKSRGLVEHSHHLLRCSACGAALLDIMVTEPNLDDENRFRADCPHCGDHSFLSPPIRGGVYIGHTRHTVYTGAEVKGGIAYLRTAKGNTAEE